MRVLPFTPNVASDRTNPTDSNVSTIDTIRKMIEVVKTNAVLPLVVDKTNQVLETAGPTTEDKINRLFNWVKTTLHFRNDEDILAEQFGLGPDKELLFTPHYIISNNWVEGDCDDYSTLLATMIVAAKLPVDVYFVTVCADSTDPDRWSHVYVAVQGCCGKVIYLDSSHGPYAGWEASKIIQKKFWLVNEGKENHQMVLTGLGEIYGMNGPPLQDVGIPATDYPPAAYNPDAVFSDPGIATSGIDWGSIGANAINSSIDIIKGVLKIPQPGQYIKTPTYETYQAPAGSMSTNFSMAPVAGNTWLIIGGLALGAFLLMKSN